MDDGLPARDDGHRVAVGVDDVAARGNAERTQVRIRGNGPGRRAVHIHAQRGRTGGAVGVVLDSRRSTPGASIEEIQVERRGRVDAHIACELLVRGRKVHLGAVAARRTPVVGVVAGHIGKPVGCRIEVKHSVGQHDVCRGVGEVEHGARGNGGLERGRHRLKARGIARGGLGIARGGLIDDDTVGDRVRTGETGVGALELAVVDEDGVEALHASNLAGRRSAHNTVHLDVARGVQKWRTRAGRGEGAAGNGDGSAAAVGRNGGAVVTLSCDVDLRGNHNTCVGGIQTARVASGGVDAAIIDKCHARIGGKDAVRTLARSAQRASAQNNLGPLIHSQDDGVGTVEVAVVAVGIVAGLRDCAVLKHRHAGVLGKDRILVGLGGLNRLALDIGLLTVGSKNSRVRARIVEGHSIGAARATRLPLGLAALRGLAARAALPAIRGHVRRGAARLVGQCENRKRHGSSKGASSRASKLPTGNASKG